MRERVYVIEANGRKYEDPRNAELRALIESSNYDNENEVAAVEAALGQVALGEDADHEDC